jgi:hypothetical protein
MESSPFNFPKQQQQPQPNIQNKVINNNKVNNNNNNQNINTPFENINQINSVIDPFGSSIIDNDNPFEIKQQQISNNNNNQGGLDVQMSDINDPYEVEEQMSNVNNNNNIINPFKQNNNPMSGNGCSNPFGDNNNNQINNPFGVNNNNSIIRNPYEDSMNFSDNPFGDNNKVADPFGGDHINFIENPFGNINNNNNQVKDPFEDDFPQGNNIKHNIFEDSQFLKGDFNSNNNNNFNNPFTTPTKNTNNNNNNPFQKRDNNPPKIIPIKKYTESPPPLNPYTTHKTQILTQLLPQLTTSLHQDNLTQSLDKCTSILTLLSKYNNQIN